MLIITSAYFSHDSANNPPEKIRRLVGYCRGKGHPLSQLDMMLTPIIWCGVAPTDQELFEHLATTDLAIRNTGKTPTFRNVLREEIIDLT